MSAHTGRLARGGINKSANLGTFSEAAATAAKRGLAGIGYVIGDDDEITGVDLDDCITDSGSLSELAAEIVGYGETYVEASPSGAGLRLFARGKIERVVKNDAAGVEAYGRGRYLTVTGHKWKNAPDAINEALRTLARVLAFSKGEKRKLNGANRHAHEERVDFWANVNAAALSDLDAWFPEVFRTATKQPNGAWRVKAKDLGGSWEEDLSAHGTGIRYFGSGKGFSPITLVEQFTGADSPKTAAMWLCERLGIEPTSLGWQGTANGPASQRDSEKPNGIAPSVVVSATEQQGKFLLVRRWTPERGPGVYFDEADDAEESGEMPASSWRWFCSPIEPLAKSRSKENRSWGRLIEVTDSDGVRHVWTIPARIGPTVGDGNDFRRELVDRGLEIAPGKQARKLLSDYVTIWKPSRKVRCVSRVGWCGDAFVMPDKQLGGSEEIVLQVEGVAPEFTIAGTLDGWRSEIAARCVGNTRLLFGVSAAFTGPLLHLAGEESGGVHFLGSSSIGKTTILHAARSVWGSPLGSWRTTDNSAEAFAAGACDALLTLDEISQAPPRVVGELAYMLGNQRGKGRMNRNATLRETPRWRVVFLSTGEVGLATRLQEDGGRARAGQEVRVLEIRADAGRGMGVFEHLHGFGGAADLAEHVRLAADRNCGHAAREFLSQLTKKTPEVTRIIHEQRKIFIAEHCPKDADGQVRRACGRFALIAAAGELATTFGITEWSVGEAKAATIRCWRDWLAERGGAGAAEVREALLQVRLFLEQHGESRFSPAWDKEIERPVSNRAGFRRGTHAGATYYVLGEVFRREVCKSFDYRMVAGVMAEQGWLTREPGRLTTNVRIPDEGLQRVYVIPPEFLCGDQKQS
jgi:putative DNA primase/helicase